MAVFARFEVTSPQLLPFRLISLSQNSDHCLFTKTSYQRQVNVKNHMDKLSYNRIHQINSTASMVAL
jgi:hypothetical protein